MVESYCAARYGCVALDRNDTEQFPTATSYHLVPRPEISRLISLNINAHPRNPTYLQYITSHLITVKKLSFLSRCVACIERTKIMIRTRVCAPVHKLRNKTKRQRQQRQQEIN